MLIRMLRRDVSHHRGLYLVLVLLMVLSATLAAASVGVVITLTRAVDGLMERAGTADLVQMHSGEVDQDAIDAWVAGREDVADQQTQLMLGIDGTQLWFDGVSEAGGVQEASLVTQNPRFDLLLDLENEPLRVDPGEVAVPIYYQDRDDLEVGDTVRIAAEGFERELTISSFLRDSQMNPALASSKRLLVHEDDLADAREHLDQVEHLIEFRLHDPADLGEFAAAYRASGLPQAGVAVDSGLFRLMGLLTDGLLSAVVIFVSLVLLVIAGLCLRFSFLTSVETDRREIGVLKAVGVPGRRVKGIYLAKYGLLAAGAAVVGYLLSLVLVPLLARNVSRYNGVPSAVWWSALAPALAATLVMGTLVLFCLLLLRRVDQESAVEALRSAARGGNGPGRVRLHRAGRLDPHVRLGLMDLLARPRVYLLTLAVYLACAFVAVVPVGMATTVASPTFITYLGVAPSDVRVDLRDTGGEAMAERFEQARRLVADDPQVERQAALVTHSTEVYEAKDDAWSRLTVENGDHSVFPTAYLEGQAPVGDDEIALSWMNADQMGVGLGDTLRVRAGDDEELSLSLSGIYQDVTNGGRTAKASIEKDLGNPVWYVISADLAPGVDVEEVTARWGDDLAPARVTDTAGYLEQTLGGVGDQLRIAAVVSVVVAALLAALMTSLFVQLLLARDVASVTIQQALGVPARGIRVQYLTRTWVLLLAGVALGTVAAVLLGPPLVSAVMSLMGATRVELVLNPWLVLVLCPVVLVLAVGAATLASTSGIRRHSITTLAAE